MIANMLMKNTRVTTLMRNTEVGTREWSVAVSDTVSRAFVEKYKVLPLSGKGYRLAN